MPVIVELKAVVDAKSEFILSQEKQFKSYIERSCKDEKYLQELVEAGRNLLNVSSERFETKEREFKQKISILELENLNLTSRVELLKNQLDMTVALLNEERETLKATQEMIYLRTGMKREVFLVSEKDNKNEEAKPQHSGARTRSQIKNELEERATRLLREQRDREASLITKGDLAPEGTKH